MRYLSPPARPRRQDGSVAVEAALIIALILVPLMAFILLFGRYFWYYTVAQKAVHDATLYMASAPLADIRSSGAPGLANHIIQSETADMDQTTRSTLGPTTECWFRFPANAPYLTPLACTTATMTPVLVRTSVSMTVVDPFLAPMTASLTGSDGLPIIAQSTMRYVGR